ncbi:glycosyl transferase [Longispora fulva]|uniref:Glycosyltransferase involved in cell wall biosynthesis n=1 Tax=Longispora fulva TaxID=619741 RepID=A0A8J7GXG4_9ACTN|nr:glycosyltransferase [Longispora fulva]MBG6140879.1 glycosyltransferase involved in cell wall biosynthesis [Longispora fulva]GIG60855.1 glycosyl transferase [Longispora fulva]
MRLTVGMPVYNGEKYVAETIAALLAQDYDDFELLISDNCSTDSTPEIVRSFGDDRIRYTRTDRNIGGVHNFNRVVALAEGELFKWTGYDDMCAPTMLSRCVDALDAAPGAVLAYPRTVLIDGAGERTRSHRDFLDLRAPSPWRRVARYARKISLVNPMYGVIRTAALRRTGILRTYVSSDYTMLAELAALGEFHEVPEELFFRRVHEDSTALAPERKLADLARWWNPDGPARARAPRLRMQAETARALLAIDPASAVAWTLNWNARKTKDRLSRLKRRFVR